MDNRPIYHYATAGKWMNDPNGTIYRDGVYHLFHQYNPGERRKHEYIPGKVRTGYMGWAYATSRDLVNWERHGMALVPEFMKGEANCYSGCTYPYGDGYLIAYTSIPYATDIQPRERQRFALANADFSQITRLYDKDIVANFMPYPFKEFGDPFIFAYKGREYLVVGGAFVRDGKEEHGTFLFRAKTSELTDWEFVNMLFTDDRPPIECSNVILDGDRMAYIYSLRNNRVVYVAGDFDGEKLDIRNRGVVEWAQDGSYATNLSDSAWGGKVLYAWQREFITYDGTYCGCHSIPRKVWMDERYRLHFAPIDAITTLHDRELKFDGAKVVSDSVHAHLEFSTEGDALVYITDGPRERVSLVLTGDRVILCRNSRYDGIDTPERRIEHLTRAGDKHDFNIFVDGSVIEIFVDGDVISTRMYREYAPECLMRVVEGKVTSVKAHTMRAARIVGE